jgi:hypothetical protein
MKNHNVLFTVAICGFTVLSAVLFIVNRVIFSTQPGVENVFSIIWTVVLGIVLFRLMQYSFKPKTVSKQELKRNMYGSVIFLFELMSIMVLLFSAILFTVTLTSGGNQTQLLMVIGFCGVVALSLPVGLRLLRALNRRQLQLEEE